MIKPPPPPLGQHRVVMAVRDEAMQDFISGRVGTPPGRNTYAQVGRQEVMQTTRSSTCSPRKGRGAWICCSRSLPRRRTKTWQTKYLKGRYSAQAMDFLVNAVSGGWQYPGRRSRRPTEVVKQFHLNTLSTALKPQGVAEEHLTRRRVPQGILRQVKSAAAARAGGRRRPPSGLQCSSRGHIRRSPAEAASAAPAPSGSLATYLLI